MTGREWVTALAGLHGFDERRRPTRPRAIAAVELTEAADRKIGSLQQGHAAADQAGAGHLPTTRTAHPRRAAERHGSADAAAHGEADQGVGARGTSVLVSSHILHEIESMTANIVLDQQRRIVAEGDVHHIRDLIDEHPHTVSIRTPQAHAVARELLADEGVVSVRFEPGGLVVETARPDAFYARVTDLAASGRCGAIHEITSPDDNLQAVFRYLVKA
jgi:ABC-2 type transport system ATP-binding protein